MKATMNLNIRIILLAIFFIETMKAVVKLTNVVCVSRNSSWVTIDYCRLQAVSRNISTLTIEANLLQIAQNILVRLQLMKKENGYKPWLIDYTIDGCAFMRRINHPFGKIMFNMIKDFSSISHKCPYVGKQYIRNFYYDATNLTLPMPSGDFLILLTWIFDKKPQFDTNVYFNLYQGDLKLQ